MKTYRKRKSVASTSNSERPFLKPITVQNREVYGPSQNLSSQRFQGISKLEAAFDNEALIFSGLSGSYIATVQEALIEFGFNLEKYGHDGIFGSETEDAVRTFQHQEGAVMVDGIIGPETMNLLDQVALRFEKDETEKEKKKKEKKIGNIHNRLLQKIDELRRDGQKDKRPEIFICLLKMYESHVLGETRSSTFFRVHQLNDYIHKDRGNRYGANYLPPYKVNKPDFFKKLDRYITEDSKRFQEEFYSNSNSMFQAIGRFESLKGNVHFRQTRQHTFDALETYFKNRSENARDIYSCHRQ